MTGPFRNDTRGVRTVVTHVLAIGIMAVLIITLTTVAGSYLSDQKEHAAREELRTIGNRMANEVTQLDRLSNQGGDARMRASHPDRISGSSYNVRIGKDSTCDTASFDRDRCLIIWSDELDVTQKVPLKIQNDINIEQTDPGEFTLTATATSGASHKVREVGVTELTMRVGVGRDVQPDTSGRVVNPANDEPVPKFTFAPGSPDSASTVTFNASDSRDLDGNIIEYQWDFDHSTAGPERTRTSPTVDWDFNRPGYRNVTLTVVDDDGAKTSLVKNISVSGLAYNNDLDTISSDDVEFTLTNEWSSQDVTITALRIDPTNDNIDGLDEVYLDGNTVETVDTSSDSISSGGLIVDGLNIDVHAGDTATIEFNGFDESYTSANMNGEELEVAIRHDVTSRQTNTTMFTDTINGPVVSGYTLSQTPSGVELSFRSSEELDEIRVNLQGDADGNYGSTGSDVDLTRSDFSETTTGGSYDYTVTLTGSNSPGTYQAKLKAIESAAGYPGRNTPLTDSLTRSSGFIWRTVSDWDGAADQSGIVHASFGGRQADRIQIGYPEFDQGGSNLLTYYPFDGTGSGANDVTGNSHDGTTSNVDKGQSGIFGTAYEFNGDEGVVEDSDAEAYLNGKDEITISAWVKADAIDSDMGIINGEGPEGDDDTIAIRHDDSGASAGCDECYKAGVTTSDDGETNIESSSYTQTNDWQHVVLTWDDDTELPYLYLDGIYNTPTSSEYGSGAIQDVETLLVGQGPKDEGSSDGWDGKIDEVRIYDRALGYYEVYELYMSRTEGTMTTNWKSTSSVESPNNLELKYDTEIESGETVRVKVQSDTDGDGNVDEETNNWIELDSGDSGTGSTSFPSGGMHTSSDTYRLKIRLRGSTSNDGPVVDRLELDS